MQHLARMDCSQYQITYLRLYSGFLHGCSFRISEQSSDFLASGHVGLYSAVDGLAAEGAVFEGGGALHAADQVAARQEHLKTKQRCSVII